MDSTVQSGVQSAENVQSAELVQSAKLQQSPDGVRSTTIHHPQVGSKCWRRGEDPKVRAAFDALLAGQQ